MKHAERDVQRVFDRWVNEEMTVLRRLPFGFEHVDHDDPHTFAVTDGTDEFVIEITVDVWKRQDGEL